MEQTSSFLWQLKSNIEQLPPLDLTFTAKYHCVTESEQEQKPLQYHFSLAEFQVGLQFVFTFSFLLSECCFVGMPAALYL